MPEYGFYTGESVQSTTVLVPSGGTRKTTHYTQQMNIQVVRPPPSSKKKLHPGGNRLWSHTYIRGAILGQQPLSIEAAETTQPPDLVANGDVDNAYYDR